MCPALVLDSELLGCAFIHFLENIYLFAINLSLRDLIFETSMLKNVAWYQKTGKTK